MPVTNTFEHLGTTVVSGSSTTAVTFTGLGSWSNIILVGRIQPNATTTQMNVKFGGTGSMYFQNMYAEGSSNTGVPNTPRFTVGSSSSCDLTANGVSSSVSGVSFKIHIMRQGTTRGYLLCEAGFQKSSNTMEYVTSSILNDGNITEVTLGFFTQVIKAGSTVSAYGVMI